MTQERKETTEVRSVKTDKEFIADLTTKSAAVKPDKTGRITLEGALPQVIRKPVKDKTVNGMTRITY